MTKLPNGWAKALLGDVLQLKYGKSLPQRIREHGDVPVYGSNGIVGYHTSALVDGPCTIVGRKGSIGAIHFSEKACWPIDTTYYVDDFNVVSPVFSKYLLSALPLNLMNRATAIPGLNRQDAYKLPIRLPPLAEQKRIAEKIDAFFFKSSLARSHLERIFHLVEQYKKMVLTDAFTDKTMRIQGSNGKWPKKRIGEIITAIKAGKNLQCEERPPLKHEQGILKVSAVTWGHFDPTAAKTFPKGYKPDASAKVKCGDFLFSRANTLELVGAVVIVRKAPNNLYLSDKTLRLEMPDEIKPWLLWFLRSPIGRQKLETHASGNQISMRNISQKSLRSITVPWPPAHVREKIIRRIESAFNSIDCLASEANSAQKLINQLDEAILSKALCGELSPQDPKDEPANIVLARVESAQAKSVTQKPKQEGWRIKKGDKQMARKIHEVLSESQEWLTAQEAFQLCGIEHSSQTEEIETVYAELRNLDQSGLLEIDAVYSVDGTKQYDRLKLKKVG